MHWLKNLMNNNPDPKSKEMNKLVVGEELAWSMWKLKYALI